MSEVSSMKKYVAELIGTFVLVFAGCGSVVLAGKENITIVGIAFAFGLALLAMVYAIGGISGCHINPAVSISMFAAGKTKLRDMFGYIIFQCVGAVIAALVLYAIALGKVGYSLSANGLGANMYDSVAGFSMVSAFAAELAFTFIFLLVIFGSTGNRVPKGFAGISIGLSLVLIHLVTVPVTGTSVNPARSLGPALIVGGMALNQLWLFWVAPILGGLLAAAVTRLLE